MTTPTPNRRWFHLTPDRFFIGLLAVQVFLFLSEWFQWFAFYEQKGWTVLIAVGVVCVAVVVMLVWGLVCLCVRWRFQFGFRSLLVFLVAVSVPLGWFAWEMQRARRQREAVRRIVGLGGIVYYDYQRAHTVVTVADLSDPEPPGPKWLRDWLGIDFFSDVYEVFANNVEAIDKVVLHVRELPRVRELRKSLTMACLI